MILQELIPHPSDPESPIKRLLSGCARIAGGAISFRFIAQGEIRQLQIPSDGEGRRRDELWRTTCFEAFLKRPDGGYLELNFSPSKDWAAYDFSDYRKGMTDSGSIASIEILTDHFEDALMVDTKVRFAANWALSESGSLAIGLTAVMEDISGRKSHWAILHPAEKPDFHHPDGFVYRL